MDKAGYPVGAVAMTLIKGHIMKTTEKIGFITGESKGIANELALQKMQDVRADIDAWQGTAQATDFTD
ncbi:hypothetical protein [Sodalis sp. RH20]|uniref:hypothetical protein n=1 Tax=unclassified Sodalis (in: enterobacteria) TaxID=2636512 RepID=UPI0039B3875A